MKPSPNSARRKSAKGKVKPNTWTVRHPAAARAAKNWWPVFAPPPKLTVSEWADAFRKLSPEDSAEPGQWWTSRAEYQREIMDAICDPTVFRIVWMKSAQVGATQLLGNIVGYFVDQDPAPMLVLQPTLEMGQAWSKDRLAPMIRDTPRLRGKIADVQSRSTGNTMLAKSFPGGRLTIAGSNSAASLASRPIRIVLADELDRYPPSAGTEGDPLSLAVKRTTAFWNRKVYTCSTPTVDGASRIAQEFEQSDKRYFFVPCPHCGHEQTLKWANVDWDKGPDGSHLPETARYRCDADDCGTLWSDAERWQVVSRGHWQATAAFHGVAGFHIWEAYSPWVRLADTVSGFLSAKDNPETLKTWTNTALGETWAERGEAPEWQRLYERRSKDLRLGEVPEWAGALTIGSDVQRNRIEVDVWAWGPGMQSALVDHIVIDGDPGGADVWIKMDELLVREWETAGGRKLRPSRFAIDTGDGYSTTQVYAWARKFPRQVMAIKGVGKFDSSSPVSGPTWVDVTVGGRKMKRGVQLWTVAVAVFKSETYSWLHLDQPVDGQPFPAGFIHLPQGTTDEWIQQLVAEQLRKVKSKAGFSRLEWHKTRDRNEAIDMRVYARAAAYSLGIDRWTSRHWAKARGDFHRPPSPQPVTETLSTPQYTPTQPAKRNTLTGKPRGSFLGGRR